MNSKLRETVAMLDAVSLNVSTDRYLRITIHRNYYRYNDIVAYTPVFRYDLINLNFEKLFSALTTVIGTVNYSWSVVIKS